MRDSINFMDLTKPQKDVLSFVKAFLKENGFPPTRAEIAKNFGWKSITAAHGHLLCLERKGVITIAPGISRGIAIK